MDSVEGESSVAFDGEDPLLHLKGGMEPDGLHAWVPNRASDKLVSFIDAAADHLRDLQVIDSVHFDVLTRKLTFLMYRSTAQGHDGDAHILLLDASRGMQAIAAPIPASELRPCTL